MKSRNLLMTYLNNMDNIRYLYMVACGDASAISDMYVMDDEEAPIYTTGYYEVRESEFMGMDTSGNIEPTISQGDWGWLCSAYVPIYAEEGSIICHVGCDVGMDDVMSERYRNLMYILIGALLTSGLISMGAVLFINRIVVTPLNALTMEMKKFTPAENVNYEQAGVVKLDIHSRDEINDIYQEIQSMQIRIIDYLNDLSVLQKDKEEAENAVKTKEEQLGEVSKVAYRDILTSVGSKAAYIKKCEELNQEIQEVEQIKAIFLESYENTEADPWERYSASVGMAEMASDDSTVDFVFKRADRAMYEDKELFKKKYGSYR